MTWITNAGRVIVIVLVGLLMIPAGLGLLGCTLCAFSGGFNGDGRLGFVIGATVCLGVVVGGVFVIGKLSRQR